MDNTVTAIDSYLSVLLNTPKLDAITVFTVLFLMLGRILPIMVFAPFFGAKIVPAPVRVMLSLCFCIIFMPQILLNTHQALTMSPYVIVLFLKELLIGIMLGFFSSIPFYIAQSTGSLIDHIRGASSLQVTDPTTQSQTGPIGLLYNYVLISIFFFVGGPFIFIQVIGSSFELIPITEFFKTGFFSIQMPLWKMIVGLFGYVMALAIQLGAPSIIGVLMAEMFLGIANRLAPQVQIVFLGISLKSWVGLALLAAAWFLVMNQLGKESLNWLKTIDSTMRQTAMVINS